MPAEQEACMCSHITFRLGCMRAVVTLQASLEFTRDCIEGHTAACSKPIPQHCSAMKLHHARLNLGMQAG